MFYFLIYFISLRSYFLTLGGVLRVENVLWVPKIKRSVLLVLVIEKKGFDIVFQDRQVLIKPIGSSSNATIVLGVREGN